MTSIQFSVRFCKKLQFSVRFRFYQINRGFGFSAQFFALCFLMCMHSTECFPFYCFIIGPTNCQPKWLRTTSAEIQHAEKYFVDPIMLQDELWMRQRENRLQTAEVGVLPNCRNWVFGFWFLTSVWFGFSKTDIRHFHQVPHTPTKDFHWIMPWPCMPISMTEWCWGILSCRHLHYLLIHVSLSPSFPCFTVTTSGTAIGWQGERSSGGPKFQTNFFKINFI